MGRLSERFYPGLICAAFIMLLMGLPGKCFPTVVVFWDWIGPDKIIHLILFGLLSFLVLWGYRTILISAKPSYKIKALLASLSLSILYGGATELMQKYIFVNRYGCLFDFLADTIGCVLGVIAFYFYLEKKIKKIDETGNNI